MNSVLAITRWLQRCAPWTSGLLLASFVVWTLVATDSREVVHRLVGVGDATRIPSGPPSPNESWDGVSRMVAGLLGLAVVATGVMLIGLFAGRRESRSLRAWLLFMFLLSGWIATFLGWNDLYWFGQSRRVSAEVAAANRVVTALVNDWPQGDGDNPELGFVLGYPKEEPTTLILAGEPVSVGRLRIAAVEKSADGRLIRFQLASPNNDTWLVYTPNKLRGEFVNGFNTVYLAKRSKQLADDWHLVRYTTGGS